MADRPNGASARGFPPAALSRAREGNKTRAAQRNNSSFLPYEQRKQSTLPLKAFSNREPLRAMLHDDENRLC